jgi:hypothetical protein
MVLHSMGFILHRTVTRTDGGLLPRRFTLAGLPRKTVILSERSEGRISYIPNYEILRFVQYDNVKNL